MHHEVHDTINVETGEIFMDCSKSKIFRKHLALVFGRPVITIIKTLWHLSIVGPLIPQLGDTLLGKQTVVSLLKNTVYSLTDIVRTPLYGIAMTIIHIAALVLACIDSNSLYYTRDLAGWLERKMLRMDTNPKKNDWSISPCFSPFCNLAEKVKLAEEKNEPLLSITQSIAQRGLKYARNVHDLFGNCWFHPAGTTYISPIARR
jgi:hypothetical protein